MFLVTQGTFWAEKIIEKAERIDRTRTYLQPIVTIIDILDKNDMTNHQERLKELIEESKESINLLAERTVFKT